VPDALFTRLARHGLAGRRLDRAHEAAVEVARVTAIAGAGSRGILEAGAERLLSAEAAPARRRLAAGTWLVETAQPLGAIATYLCEPASDDGLIACGWIAEPAVGDEWPVLRVVEPV
jgi:hypothetical protein